MMKVLDRETEKFAGFVRDVSYFNYTLLLTEVIKWGSYIIKIPISNYG